MTKVSNILLFLFLQFVGISHGLASDYIGDVILVCTIVSPALTERKRYLRTLHAHDICIASTGLHESIGWKTGEYVAAAKAIVSEPLCYQVPGEFREGIHYLPFTTTEECLAAVQTLLAEPYKLFAMKKANEIYYSRYLRPDVLVKNTLEIVARSCAN